MISEHRVESALACAQGGWGFCCVELVRNPALFIQSTHWSLLFPPTGHLHHSQKYHLREIWFLLGQLLHLHYIAPSPDVRFLFFRSLQGTEQMLFFFFFLMFSWKAFSSNYEWKQTTTKQALLTQKGSGELRNTGTCRHSRRLRVTFPSLKRLLWSFASLMPLTWIKLFWTYYCNDSQINCIGIRFVMMCLNVILTFWPQFSLIVSGWTFEHVLT